MTSEFKHDQTSLKHDPNAFKVGDRVRVVRKVEQAEGWSDFWVDSMNEALGLEYRVNRSDEMGVELFIEVCYYRFPSCSLELVESADKTDKEHSDGSSADYYKVPEGCTQLQDIISYLNCNAQVGEILRAVYRYGKVAHSSKVRDMKKVLFYAQAELDRLEKYGDQK